jgi:mono/diheme cytochrome c family protein
MKTKSIIVAFAALFSTSAFAQGISNGQRDVIKKLMADYASQDKTVAAKQKRNPIRAEEFSAETGKQLFLRTKNWEGEDAPSCSSCHTDDPRQKGKHAASKKPILPLAPISNPERFTNVAKVEKNFSTHCQEIYNRDCDPAEKGHYLAYFLSVK